MTASLALVPADAHAQETIRTFAYTGSPQEFTVPEGVCELKVDAFGAAGGDAFYGSPGGRGGGVHATVPVTPGDVLTIDVGGAGTGGSAITSTPAAGGYGGGGQPGAFRSDRSPGNGGVAAGGGGATTVALALEPLVIAGGGGGGAGHLSGEPLGPGGDGGQAGTNGGSPAQPGAGGGGASGGNGGTGGAGGQPISEFDQPGVPGGDAIGRVGGDGAVDLADPHMGAGGGGGGGAHGGGAGGSSTSNTVYAGGGGGGSSLGPTGATYETGVRQGDGEATLTYEAGSCPVPPPEECSNDDIHVDKTADRTKVLVGGVVRYRIRVTNTCAHTFHGATVTDDLADVLDNGFIVGPVRATTGTVDRTGRSLTWTGDLLPGQTAEITYTVRAFRPGLLHNTVSWQCTASPERKARRDCTDETTVVVRPHHHHHRPNPCKWPPWAHERSATGLERRC
ncbi:DUF11 domain-containing protein [Actinomadura harenae]|uniref:DUF11 domain-containing protein n=1 Tax=Actinomadura harenae TaxID=2483351 RepID=A0A3M2M9Y2_9ACTN|nr:DUF11 domain-containing protein [Actinomadura harenae]RMI46594.1 DUF11 domain-containing protein [Actinomadura harenae]